MKREDYRAMLAALSDADLLHESAVRERHRRDYRDDHDSDALSDMCEAECHGRRRGLWAEAVRLAATFQQRIPKTQEDTDGTQDHSERRGKGHPRA